MHTKRIAALVAVAALTLGGLTACKKDADVVNKNLATDADNFKVLRRIVFINGITDKYLLEIEGFCSVDTSDPNRWAVTCKVGPNAYKKDLLGKADNVTMLTTQLDASNVSASHYTVILKPETIIPEPEVR